MLILCPSCATSYQVDASAIGARGRSVRCLRCRSIWLAAPPANVPVLRTPEPASDEVVTAFGSELGTATTAPSPMVADAPPTAPDSALDPALESEATPSLADLMKVAADAADAPATANAEEAEPVALADIPIPVADAPPLAPGSDQGPPHPIERPTIENGPPDIETAAARRRRNKANARRRAKPKARMPLVIMALVLVCAALLAWRNDIVRHMPQLASFYASIGLPVNLRGLSFANVTIGREMHDGVPVLVVEGMIVNSISTAVEVPRLRFALRNAAGAEVYSWTAVPAQTVLEPGATLPFRSRLASPPDDGHDVQVRFFTRRDVVAGLH
jgi:predicted Zn finger-like uncharacterized protein